MPSSSEGLHEARSALSPEAQDKHRARVSLNEELEAIEKALARLTAPPADPRSAWWRAGMAEDLSEEEEPA